MIDYHVIPSMIFCSLGVILVCFAIAQVRRERTELHIRMTKIERMLKKFEEENNKNDSDNSTTISYGTSDHVLDAAHYMGLKK